MIPDELKRMKPLSGKDRLGANRDSEYLGAEDIDPGTEPVLTIDAIYNGMVTLQRGKENKDVITFKEQSVPGIKNVRPLIVNATSLSLPDRGFIRFSSSGIIHTLHFRANTLTKFSYSNGSSPIESSLRFSSA